MAFQSVPFTCEVDVIFRQNLEDCQMTFYGRKLSGYDQTDVDNLAAAMDAWADTQLKTVLSTSVTYLRTEVKGLQDELDLFAIVDTETGVGSVASEPLTNQNCLSVSRRTGFTGRSARGRVYFPLNSSFLTTNENIVDAADGIAILDVLDEVRQSMIFASFEEVVVSRVSNGVKRTEGLTLPVTTYFIVSLNVSSQQRRMPGK
jgi:hypothetical protein